MTETTIYIPTIARSGNQKTWESISPYWRDRTFLVANEDDAEALEMLGYPVIACPAEGIAATRQWILENHDRKRGDVVMMLDDDCIFSIRREDDPTKFTKMSEDHEFNIMMDRIEHMMEFTAMGGIADRGGANRVTSPYRFCGRMSRALIINKARTNPGFRFDMTSLMEDFAMNLQHLTAGYPTICLNMYTIDDYRGSNSPGGCSTYRSTALQLEAAMELHEAFPEFVKVVQRPGWNGMGDTRADVRIQWAKAFQAGQEARSLIGESVILPAFDKEGNLYHV